MTPCQAVDAREPLILPRAALVSGAVVLFGMSKPRRHHSLVAGLGGALALAGAAQPALAAPTFERVLEGPCRALALDREPYWAALGDDFVTVQDKRGVHRQPLPSALQGSGQELGIFFGRDYRVRIAGTAHTPSADEARYYRSLPTGLRPAPEELGPLGRAGAPGLTALLGTLDPEIVCRPGLHCLIKRTSGWTKASAPVGLNRVGLSLETGWALAGPSLFRLEKDWVRVGPATATALWQHADDAFLRADRACVVERKRSRLFHFDGQRWHSADAPVAGPRSLWGSTTSLWLGGDGGAAVFEEGQWRPVASAPPGVAQIMGRDADAKDVWICSEQGVFRQRRE